MKTVQTISELRAIRPLWQTLGFVPTMGFLHEGHLSLVRRAKRDCGAVAVSIFVNPSQFGPAEDYGRYPRNLDRDLASLLAAETDVVFVPAVEEIYPAGDAMMIDPGSIATRLEGAARPGHFRGVATIVCKLFNILQPTRSYFGQKDWQQTVVIKKMVDDLNVPTEIVVCATCRESDGMAMSSRNVYLEPSERAAATALYRSLTKAEQCVQLGEQSAAEICRVVRNVIAQEPLVRLEYVCVAHPETVEEIDMINEDGAVLSIAARVGATRLIDNVRLKRSKSSAPSARETSAQSHFAP
jgi:pantoate--beta-alanine ligase